MEVSGMEISTPQKMVSLLGGVHTGRYARNQTDELGVYAPTRLVEQAVFFLRLLVEGSGFAAGHDCREPERSPPKILPNVSLFEGFQRH